MTAVQIILISVACAAAVLLLIALLITRRQHVDEQPAPAEPSEEPSFLDQAPQDTFSVLGKAEQPVEDITLDPALERATAAESARAERRPPPGGLGLDWRPDLSVRELEPEPSATPDETEITGELRSPEAAALPTQDAPPAPEGMSGDQAVAPEPARPAEGGPAAGAGAAMKSGPESRLVPLSDIIVTTSDKMIDLQDPDVRRMLTDLVTFEIDQADAFSRQGQFIDAVLQLTEAEKVSRALGMTEAAQHIRTMMEEIRRAG